MEGVSSEDLRVGFSELGDADLRSVSYKRSQTVDLLAEEEVEFV